MYPPSKTTQDNRVNTREAVASGLSPKFQPYTVKSADLSCLAVREEAT